MFSPPILTCKERPAHENGSLKELNCVIMWASESLCSNVSFSEGDGKPRGRRRRRLAMLQVPKGAAARTLERGGGGRWPREGEEAEGHPSLILFYCFIILSVRQIQNRHF